MSKLGTPSQGPYMRESRASLRIIADMPDSLAEGSEFEPPVPVSKLSDGISVFHFPLRLAPTQAHCKLRGPFWLKRHRERLHAVTAPHRHQRCEPWAGRGSV